MQKNTSLPRKKPILHIDINAPRVYNPHYEFNHVEAPVEVNWKGLRNNPGRRTSPRHVREIEKKYSNSDL